MEITISRLHFPVTTLGPGRRVGIWFQGCSIRCEGCVSADTWGFKRGLTSIAEVLATIGPWLRAADGVTISGGEPFDQAEALLELLQAMQLSPHQDVLVYSGYPFEKLISSSALASGRIDALISDPFDSSTSQSLALRGSDNQRLNLLTERGRLNFAEYDKTLSVGERSLDVMFDDDGTIWFAGIPKQGDMLRLRDLLYRQGHEIVTTDATRQLP